jgi:8-oxo-dGTP pyrophosphatase MutT (NUDIX family)
LDSVTVEQQLQLWADELRAIANEGLHWSAENPYDAARYQRILKLAAAMFAIQDLRDVDTIERAYHQDLGHVAPYPCGDAAVFDRHGRILLIQRKDNALWAMPGGAFEVGETPAEGACREAWEETGLEVEPVGLSGVYDSRYWHGRSPYQLYQFVFLCRPRHPEQSPRVTEETLDVRWCTEQEAAVLPLDPNHVGRVEHAFRRWRGELASAVFDPLSDAEILPRRSD